MLDGSDPTVASSALSSAQLIGQVEATAVQQQALARSGGAVSLATPVDVRPRVWYNPDMASAIFMVPALIGLLLQMQARAAVGVAEANLAQLTAGSRAEDIAAAQAQVDQAQAARDGAAQAYQNALKALENPQELDAQVIQAQATRDSAQRALAQVRASSRPEDIASAEAALAQAHANLQATKDGLSTTKTQPRHRSSSRPWS